MDEQYHTPSDNAPQFVTSDSTALPGDYTLWLKDIKLRYRQAQCKAAIKVNTELLQFYWQLGKDIVAMRIEDHWGKGVMKQLSLDLRAEFPDQAGFSHTNLKYIKRWYSFYNQEDIIGQQVVDQFGFPSLFGQIPWGHHIHILTHCSSTSEALFYINRTIEDNWSRRTLEDNMEADLYRRQAKAVTNFEAHLPAVQSKLAEELLKDPYKLDFLSLREDYDERDMEDALAQNITRFLLELGHGFAYVGRQMELRMPGGQSFFPDMVFYNIPLKCYIVVELKVVKFIPEFVGKLNFYVTAADKLLRGEGDNPSIGLLICRSKDDTVVEWSLQDINKPIGVSSYQLQEVVNRTIKELESKTKERKQA